MNIFKNKKILITGHTGFKGSWLAIWLVRLGANVVGISKDTVGEKSHYLTSNISEVIDDRRGDVTDLDSIKTLFMDVQPDFIFHLAAQALVRPAYNDPLETITTNTIGMANILEALKTLEKKVIAVMITSDKAYDNVEWVWGYKETDRLGGKDPYSASKGMAELVIRSYVDSFFGDQDSNLRVGIARAGNVIGGGDWAVDRIVPDCMEAWSKGQSVNIRSPHATRPWQHVLEPLSGYLCLAENLYKNKYIHGEAYNFGPSEGQNFPVSELITEMSKYWHKIKWNDTSGDEGHLHEAGLLKLNCDKALSDLKWCAALNFEQTIELTVDWYKKYYQNPTLSTYPLTVKQIDEYTKAAKLRAIDWTNND